MKKIFFYFVLGVFCSLASLGQQPWQNPLKITFSNDGTIFSTPTIFQDSAGVPSVAMLDNGTLISAFQWFPAPMFGPGWDSVAVKFSYDMGQTWAYPVKVNFLNMPSNFKRPFDPTVVNAGNGQIRMYFSCGPTGHSLGNSIDTYSAISSDGINFTYEPNPRFGNDSLAVIDPAAIFYNGVWHLTAPRGAPQAGAFHATSNDGLNFTQQANIPSDNFHQWTGNLMNDGTSMRFYGTSTGPTPIWWASSTDGFSWGSFNNTNIQGGDPAVIKLPNGQYMMIFVGLPGTTDAQNKNLYDIEIYPNPFSEKTIFRINYPLHNATLLVNNLFGQTIAQIENINQQEVTFNRGNISNGMYVVQLIQDDKVLLTKKLIITD